VIIALLTIAGRVQAPAGDDAPLPRSAMSVAAQRIPEPDRVQPQVAEAAGVPVLLVTTDDQLWAQLSAAVPELRLEQHDTVPDLVAGWDAARAAVVVIDARLGADVVASVRGLVAHSRLLVPVALIDERGTRNVDKLGLAGILNGQIHDSFEPDRTRSVLARARSEALARIERAHGQTARIVAPSRAWPPSRRRVLAAGAALLLLVAATAAVLLWPAPAPTPSAGVTAPPPRPPAALATPQLAAVPAAPVRESRANPSADDVERLLADARRAMADKRYVEPENASALAAYHAVLAVDPDNGEAQQGIDRIAEVLVQRADAALNSHEFATALRSLEVARNLRPQHPRLAALDAQIGQRAKEYSATQIEAALQANSFERAVTLLKQAERAGNVSTAQADQLRERLASRQAAAALANLVHLAQARVSQGKLLEPASDSAFYYLGQLGTPADAAVAADATRIRAELLRKLQAEVHSAAAQGRWADAEALLAGLRTAGAAPAQYTAAEADLAQAKEQARAATAAREAATSAKAAQAAAAAAPAIATPPRLKKALSVVYPVESRLAGHQGWVDVEFTVSTSGMPEDVRVAAAEVPHEFDSAAIKAVRQARFEPGKGADGSMLAVPMRLRLRFALDSKP
jgi:TonB family protein